MGHVLTSRERTSSGIKRPAWSHTRGHSGRPTCTRPKRRAGSIAVEAKMRDDFGQVARSHSTACYLESLQRVPLRLHAATFIDCRRAHAEKKPRRGDAIGCGCCGPVCFSAHAAEILNRTRIDGRRQNDDSQCMRRSALTLVVVVAERAETRPSSQRRRPEMSFQRQRTAAASVLL